MFFVKHFPVFQKDVFSEAFGKLSHFNGYRVKRGRFSIKKFEKRNQFTLERVPTFEPLK